MVRVERRSKVYKRLRSELVTAKKDMARDWVKIEHEHKDEGRRKGVNRTTKR